MKYSAKKNTYSFAGADFAPSCRSAVNSAFGTSISDTATAVSVLFSLIIIWAVLITIGIMTELAIIRIFVIGIIMILANRSKQTVKLSKLG